MKKLSRKYGQNKSGVSTMLIVVIVVAVIVIAGVVVYVLMNQNPAPSESPEPTSTPQPTSQAAVSPFPTPTQGPTPSGVQDVSGAISLQFTVLETYTDGNSTVRAVYCKNIGTNNFMLRMDSTPSDSSQMIDIAYGEEAWMYTDNRWSDFGAGSQNQKMRNSLLRGTWQGYVDALTEWSGLGDYSYSWEYTHRQQF